MIGSDFMTRMAAINGGPTYSAFGAPSDVGPLTPTSTAQLQPSALPPIYKSGIAGSFQRMGDNIGNFLNSNEGRAALMRSAGATLNGGLGAGIEAGSNYMDKTKANATTAAQTQFENARETGQDALARTTEQHRNDMATIMAAIEQSRAQETARSNMANESLTGNQQRVQLHNHDNASGDAALQAETTVRGQDVGAATSRANSQDDLTGRRYTADTDFAGKKYVTDNAPEKAAGIGSRGSLTVKTPASTSGGFLGIGSTPVPASETTIVAPKISAPPAAIAQLKAHPETIAQFETIFGTGSGRYYLNGGQ